ncbi:MAG: radical SAM protein [Sedimentisphaerales bacterium]|nr:radical SAM protein [Sedimentisphaerales bacterium]
MATGLVEGAGDLGARKVSFGGGEPTASEDFLPVVQRTAALGMEAEVFTCGFKAQREGPTSLDSRLLDTIAPLSNVKLIFSTHGHAAGVHDLVTQTQGSFDALVRSITASRARGMTCEMNFVPLRVNVAGFSKLVGLAEQLGVDRVSVLRFVPQGRGLKNARQIELSPNEEDAFIAELVRLRTETDVEIRTGSPFNGIVPGNAVPCRAGSGKLVVQADGNVLPCEVFKHDERKEWNLSVHHQSIAEILKSPEVRALRAFLENTSCLDCPIHKVLRDQLIAEVEHEHVSEATVSFGKRRW